MRILFFIMMCYRLSPGSPQSFKIYIEGILRYLYRAYSYN